MYHRGLSLSLKPVGLSPSSIAYTPTPNTRRQQAPQDTTYINASADSSNITDQGLDGDLTYTVTVAAATRAGIGEESVVVEVDRRIQSEIFGC